MNNVLHTKWGTAKVYDEYYVIMTKQEGNFNKKLHRLIYESFWGVKLPEEIVVHHKDGNKLNNCILNLEAMTKSEHTTHHMIGNTYNLGNHRSDETKHKQSISKIGVPRSDNLKKKLSLQKNNTGYYRVSKRKRKNSQGFAWRYRFHELGKDIVIEAMDLEKLKKKVIDRGYEWKSLEELKSEITD